MTVLRGIGDAIKWAWQKATDFFNVLKNIAGLKKAFEFLKGVWETSKKFVVEAATKGIPLPQGGIRSNLNPQGLVPAGVKAGGGVINNNNITVNTTSQQPNAVANAVKGAVVKVGTK
jgi:hypothetical protein